MDGFKRPTRKPDRPQVPPRPAAADKPAEESIPVPPPMPLSQQSVGVLVPDVPPVELQPPEVSDHSPERVLKKKKTRFAKTMIIIGVVVGLVAALFAGAFTWYVTMTLAPNPSDDKLVSFEVKENSSLNTIADQLEDRGLIKDAFAFTLYVRINGQQNALQAGTCNLTPAETVSEIVDKLVAGCKDFKSITFYPGATIEKPTFKPEGSTISLDLYVKNMLKEAGYSDGEISQALSADYDSPLFEGKPASATLEGYIFGETYYVATDATATDVLRVAFDHLYEVVKEEALVSKYKAQDLNLYEGLTMASIVQRELNCEDKPTQERKDRCHGYQRTIASVFYNRLEIGMPLGSDSTFIYAADMLGVPATSRVDSPYNTYRVAGLPPGPIGAPGRLALQAAANPDQTDYLYFVAGDDGLIYFSRTQAEHEANTAKHCHVLCAY